MEDETHTAPGEALLGQTPWQTVGPFFHYALPWKGGADLLGQSEIGPRLDLFPAEHDLLGRSPMPEGVHGRRIAVTGRVFDAAGAPIPDAMLEIWQADAEGRYADAASGFIGFGRSSTDQDGAYRFVTIKPGRVPGPGNRTQAPHIAVGVFGRGLLKRLVTRIYFADEPSNDEDPILELVPSARRATLIAQPGAGDAYRLDIRLQGDAETVFFDV